MFAKQYYLASVLRHALLESNESAVKELLQMGADPNYVFDDDSSPIHVACSSDSDNINLASLLLKYNGNPNLRNSSGLTPMHTAAACGNIGIIQLLMSNGGLVFQKDCDGKDAFSWAKPGVNSLLKQYLNKSEENGKSLLKVIQSAGKVENCSSIWPDTEKGSFTPDSNTNLVSLSSAYASITKLSDLSSFDSKVVLSDIQGCSLIETRISPDSVSSFEFGCDTSDESDWRTFSKRCSSSNDACNEPVKIPDEIINLTDVDLRKKLIELGVSPGPVARSTRRTLEMKLLSHLQLSHSGTKETPDEFLAEVNQVLNGKLDESAMNTLEEDMMLEFTNPLPRNNWREGVQKTYFNYLLLDPRVSQNLPVRAKHMDQQDAFKIFLKSIFYIGKGRQSRPYEHFKEAMSCCQKTAGNNMSVADNRKVNHILDIWDNKMGIVSLHVFHNIIAVEAYTREACMIDALGLERLTNQCRGQFYGPCATWGDKKKRLLGAWLLKRAFGVLLSEGERQIKPQNV